MKLICPTDLFLCKPFHRGVGDNETGPRIGGRPPYGVSPSERCSKAKYLLTIPLNEDPPSEVSMFYSAERFHRLSKVPNNKIVQEIGPYIDVVIHKPSWRDKVTELASELSEHPLVISDPVEDWFTDEDGQAIILPDHKIGGRPHFFLERDDLVAEVKQLQLQGYLHILQLEFISGDDAEWKGSWPFADGIFHLFGKPTFQCSEWCWLWQY